jgi:hypothetical protein
MSVIKTFLKLKTRASDEQGVVWALVAVALPLLLIVGAFGIDVGHWYDYKRTLQVRADAAALSGGDSYGNTCFSSTPPAAGLNSIGQAAANYSGPGPNSTLPAPFTYLGGGPYNNVPNLKAASLDDYFVMFNSTKNASQTGAQNYDMASAGVSGTGAFCSSVDEAGKKGPLLDVRVTQKNVPLFFKLPFGVLSAISAHARVSIQGLQSEVTAPIGVRDAGLTPCVSAIFYDETTGAPLTVVQDGKSVTSVKLTAVDPLATPVVWTNTGLPAQVTMPAVGDNLSVQTFLNNCSTSSPNGDTYNFNAATDPEGLAYINVHGTATPGATGPPLITTGGVKLNGGSFGGACDPYFFLTASSGSTCTIGVTANVAFQAGVNLAIASVIAKDQLTGQTVQLVHGAGNVWATAPGTGLPMDVGTGGHNVELSWSQKNGTVGATVCGPGPGNPKPCTGTFGGATGTPAAVQQRTVAGFNGENACVNPTIDSGPNAAITIGDSGAGTLAGEDAFASGATKSLVVTANIAGLANASPSAPPICLRVAVQNDHQTGIIDCGQGNGNSSDITAIENGCPNPVQINTRLQPDGSLACAPPISPLDCVTTTQGARNIMAGFEDPIDPDGNANDCTPDNWVLGNPITLDDPRAFAMIITSPSDLSNQTGNTTVPIRNFAIFYVTGWSDKGRAGDAGCTTLSTNTGRNEAFPGPAGGELKGELWGHWVSLAINSSDGTGNGTPCAGGFGNCIPVLTR